MSSIEVSMDNFNKEMSSLSEEQVREWPTNALRNATPPSPPPWKSPPPRASLTQTLLSPGACHVGAC